MIGLGGQPSGTSRSEASHGRSVNACKQSMSTTDEAICGRQSILGFLEFLVVFPCVQRSGCGQ